MQSVKGTETKNLIREAAFRLFLTEDYETVSLKDIEKITKMTRGCTSYHYPTKKDLLVDVIDVYILDTQKNKHQSDSIYDMSLLEYINYYVENIAKTMDRLSQFVIPEAHINGTRAYINLVLQAEKYYPGFHQMLNEIESQEIMQLKAILKRAQDKGEIRNTCNIELFAQQMRLVFLGKSYQDALKNGLNINALKEQLYFLYFLIKSK